MLFNKKAVLLCAVLKVLFERSVWMSGPERSLIGIGGGGDAREALRTHMQVSCYPTPTYIYYKVVYMP